nr:uncharacterized protein LOC107392027 [Nothobranchius furzeri]
MFHYLLLFYLPGSSLCLEVRQSHSDLITKPGKKVEIFCSHDKTDFWIMLWYQRSPGDTPMNLRRLKRQTKGLVSNRKPLPSSAFITENHYQPRLSSCSRCCSNLSFLFIMIRFLLCCFLTGGFSLEVQIHQTPSALIRKVGEDVQLVCSHGHIDYRVMLWYQWLAGDLALKLIGYGYSEFRNDSVEETFRNSRFSLAGDLSGNKNRSGSLFIKNLSPQEHTATYFCAARKAQYTKHPPAPHKNHLPADWLLGCVLSSEFDLNTADFGVQAPLTPVYASFSGAGATNSSPRGPPSYTSEPFSSSNTPDLNNK